MSEIRRVNTHNKTIKPWFNKDEWKHVYELLFNNNESSVMPIPGKVHQALVHLNVWKSRVDLLPSAIEGTIIILEALNRDKSAYSISQLREAHSFSILRFLNVCVTSRSKQGGFKTAAISQNIPQWIIEIRNDISHDQKLPSLICLNVALRVCFKWLRMNYWDAEYDAKKHFIPTPIDTRKLEALMQIYFNVLTPDYNLENVVAVLSRLGLTADLSKKNLKRAILSEIELSLPIPHDSAVVLCKIIMSTFITRYLADKNTVERLSLKILDEIIIFLYDNEIIYTFVEVLLSLNKRHYQDHVLYFYSKVLDRIFTSLYNTQNERKHSTSIQFGITNAILPGKLYELYDMETWKPMPNTYALNYMSSFSKLLNYNLNYVDSVTTSVMMKNISGLKLEKNYNASGTIYDLNILKECDTVRNVDVNIKESYRENAANEGNVWSIVADTSIFQKCALGDYPAIFRETAADALYNHIK